MVAQFPFPQAGTDPIPGVDLQAEMLAPLATSRLSTTIAGDPHRRHLLMQSFQINLDSNGQGTIPPGMLSEYIDEGSVRDGDTSANNGYGNVLVRIHQFDDFVEWRDTRFGYYCLHDGKFYTSAIGSGSPWDTLGPLTVDCAANIDTSPASLANLSDELTDDLVEELARLIRLGVASGQ